MIKLALIGPGIWGKNYLSTVSKMHECQITHIVARTEKSLSQFPDFYKKTIRYQELLDEKDIDGVIIATPAVSHFQITSAFVKQNIPVLIEKPVLISATEASRLNQIISRGRSVVMAGHIFTYHPAFQKLLDLYKDIGTLQYVESIGCDWGPLRTDISALWDWLPHDASMCLKLFHREPDEVTAWALGTGKKVKIRNFDMVWIRLRFQKKIPVFIKIGSLSPVKTRSFKVVGTKGSIVFDDTKSEKLQIFQPPKMKSVPFSQTTPLENELSEFVRRINNKRGDTDIPDIIKVTNIIEAVQSALITGKSIYTQIT